MNGQFYYFEGMKYILNNAFNPSGLAKITAQAVNGNSELSGVSSYADLYVGQQIDGDTVADGTYILDLDNSSGTVTLSQPAIATSPSGGSSTFVVGGSNMQNLPLTCHLLQGQIPQNSVVQFSQYTEANYDGYLPQLLSGPIIVNSPPPRSDAVASFNRVKFVPTDYQVQNDITGHVITYTPPGSSTPIPCWAEVYASSLPIAEDGDLVTVNPVASFAFDQTAGVASPGVG